eukprot:TRINITY_DN3912_c0_g1_i12.p1 TRINITY_DN3912_c0_g1~~TRINITY_DN3912_c0_g1_i12.p1  ORF type:complete len:770 (+),score=264.45 TRINITY_DN3912_c0_g1_i12:167-2476(+)
MPKQHVKVVVRTRPTANFAQDTIHIDNNTVGVTHRKSKDSNNAVENHNFTVDQVFHNASQETIYDECVFEMVEQALKGYNCTLFAYGQTGAGKTFTVTGGTDNYKYRGLIPRAISHIFREVNSRPDEAFKIQCSYLEIYNESLFDLLGSLPEATDEDLVVMGDNARGGTYVKGLMRPIANTEEDALNLLFEGEANRAISAHSMNKSSSRSHCIFTIYMERRSRIESQEKVIHSKMHFVDLAGSERTGKTGSGGVLLQEAKYINKSLSFLEQVILALASKTRDHIPFRQSKLTNILKDSLGGNCKTTMIANIHCEISQLEETLSTLKFATRVMKVSNDAIVNVESDPSLLLKRYEQEIKDLKAELAMHDMLANKSRVSYEPYTEEQRYELKKTVQRYIDGEIDELESLNLRQINETYRCFKQMMRNVQSEVEASIRRKFELKEKGESEGHAAGDGSGAGGDAGGASSEVGDTGQNGHGFAIGKAPEGAKPDTPVTPKAGKGRKGKEVGGKSKMAPSAATDQDNTATLDVEAAQAPQPQTVMPPRQEAFELFKQNEERGQELNEALVANKQALKSKKQEHRHLTAAVNRSKQDIDATKAALSAKTEARTATGADDDVIDEEEFALIKKLKDAKKQYRADYTKVTELKSEIDYTSRLIEQTRRTLLQEFDEWYTAAYGEIAGDTGDVVIEATPRPTSTQSTRSKKGGGLDEELDEEEQFEAMEKTRIMEQDPEAYAFYNARRQNLANSKGRASKRGGIAARKTEERNRRRFK